MREVVDGVGKPRTGVIGIRGTYQSNLTEVQFL